MPLNSKIVESRLQLIPFLLYKVHSAETLEQLPIKIFEDPLLGLRGRVAIDPRWAQRLQDAWSDVEADEYLNSFYYGNDNGDSFVLVSLTEIKRILEKTIKTIEDLKSKSTFKTFLKDVDAYIDDGKEYLMINGQHRDEVFDRMWNSQIQVPKQMGTYKENVKYWGDLDFVEQYEALTRTHPILFIEKLGKLDDIEEQIIRSNIGNAWNKHEQRTIKASHLMSELVKLDDHEPAVRLFKKLGTATNSYNLKKKGISFLASQMYYQYRNANDSKYYTILGINNKTLDKMVCWDSDMWTKTNVTEFITFFKKVIRELEGWYKKLPKKNSKLIRNKISTLQNYFMFRLVLAGKTNHTFYGDVYTITNEKTFMVWYTKREAERLEIRNNLTDDGVKKYDELHKNGELDADALKLLEDKYIQGNAYTYLLGGTSPEYKKKIITRIWDDFMYDLTDNKLVGMVQKVGGAVSSRMKDEVRRIEVVELDTYDQDEMMALLDTDKTDIGHKNIPKSKGGRATMDNLYVQEQSWNRSEQDNH